MSSAMGLPEAGLYSPGQQSKFAEQFAPLSGADGHSAWPPMVDVQISGADGNPCQACVGQSGSFWNWQEITGIDGFWRAIPLVGRIEWTNPDMTTGEIIHANAYQKDFDIPSYSGGTVRLNSYFDSGCTSLDAEYTYTILQAQVWLFEATQTVTPFAGFTVKSARSAIARIRMSLSFPNRNIFLGSLGRSDVPSSGGVTSFVSLGGSGLVPTQTACGDSATYAAINVDLKAFATRSGDF